MEQFNSIVNENLGWVHSNKIVYSIISLILAIYFIQARPKLPSYIEKVFENSVFRFLVISFIVYQSNKDPQLSIIIAAAFLITMHMINKNVVENIQFSPGMKPINIEIPKEQTFAGYLNIPLNLKIGTNRLGGELGCPPLCIGSKPKQPDQPKQPKQ